MMSGSKAPDFDAYGLVRARHVGLDLVTLASEYQMFVRMQAFDAHSIIFTWL